MKLPFAAAGLLALLLCPAGARATERPAIADPSLSSFLDSFEEGTRRFMNGDTALWKANAAQTDDALIMGAWGAYELGWPAASARYDWAAARFKDSSAKLEIEYLASAVSGDLAYVASIERATVLLAGQEQAKPMALRVTHVFRKQDDGWKMILRHADPLMGKIATAAVIEK